jgi:hypothetical protein
MPFLGWRMPSLSSSFEKRSRSSARSIMSGEVPRIGMPASSSAAASFSGVWPPNWTMTPCSVPFDCSVAEDLQHVLGRQRLEIEPVGGVVVGRDGFRVAVDHDRFVAGILQREGGMAAAIVELDALADAVRTAAEDDDLLGVRRLGLATGAPANGLHRSSTCRRRRGEFGRAGVDALVDRMHAERCAAP